MRWMDEVLKDELKWWVMTIAWAGREPNQKENPMHHVVVGTMGLRIPLKIHLIHGLLAKPVNLPHGWRIMKISLKIWRKK